MIYIMLVLLLLIYSNSISMVSSIKALLLVNPEGLNHGVVLVGYGHDDDEDKDYSLIRN